MPKPENPGSQGKGKGKEKKPKKPKKQKNLHGIITAIAFDPDVLTLRVKGKAAEFSVSTDVTVSINKEDAEYGDLLVRDNVFAVQDAAGAIIAIDARREEEEEETEEPEVPEV